MPRPDNSYPEGRDAARQLDEIVQTLGDAANALEDLEMTVHSDAYGVPGDPPAPDDVVAVERLRSIQRLASKLDEELARFSRTNAKWSAESGHEREAATYHEES